MAPAASRTASGWAIGQWFSQARTSGPSAARTAVAISTAPGVSPWQQMVSARIATRDPSTATTAPSAAIDAACAAAASGSVMREPSLGPGLERPVGQVPPIGEGLRNEADARVGRGPGHRLGRGEAIKRQGATESRRGPGDGRSQCRVAGGLVVQRAMGLHVVQLHAVRAAERLQGADLVADHRLDLGGLEGHRPATETEQVGVARLGADGHAGALAQGDGPLHDHEIAGMEATGDVRARDLLDEAFVVAEGPSTEALAEVGVQIHGCIIAPSPPRGRLHRARSAPGHAIDPPRRRASATETRRNRSVAPGAACARRP